MDFVIIGTYDHTIWYETRLMLMLAGLVLAIYQLTVRRESRHLVIFLSSSLMMGLMEYALQAGGLRGPGYTFSIFGQQIPPAVGPLLQGLLEGGLWGLMALWFADLRSSRAAVSEWGTWVGGAVFVLLLSLLTGWRSGGLPPTSVQPIFSSLPILVITSIIFFSLVVAWRKDALAVLANYYGGLLVFALLSLGPLHLFGARYVGVVEGLAAVRAGASWQIPMMLLSYIYESAGGKLHYFMIPFAFGLVSLRQKSAEEAARVSYQHLQSLTERGWRKKSKPFQRPSR
jgi:hypothetical protein